MTVVWWAAPVAPAGAPGLVALLDRHERDRLDRFRRPADQARYLAAHALVRLVLAESVGTSPAALEFDRTCRCGEQHGKPVLAGGPGFSLTHAGDLVGVAVHPVGDVGLDVEQVRELGDLEAMAAHVCSPRESAADAVADPGAFFTLWTRKEAYMKATGAGFALPPQSFAVEGLPAAGWTLRDLPVGAGFAACVAVRGPLDPLRYAPWPPAGRGELPAS
jgi:4'-phosphopantetheinyl transferase